MMRVSWRPGSVLDLAEEVLREVETCPNCGRALEKPALRDVSLTLSKEDD